MSLRKEFAMKALGQEANVAELCRIYGVSRKTAYKWLKRFRERGLPGLVDDSRKPHTSPSATTEAIREAIIRLKHEHPSWGPMKLAALMVRTHGLEAPSWKTVERVVRKAGLVQKRHYRNRIKSVPTKVPDVEVLGPNDLWTVDFKGWWRTTDGRRCDPLTVRDAHSRFILTIRLMEKTDHHAVRAVFEALFKQYGLPKAIQSDNGPPFASVLALAGLTRLSAWWIQLGIDVIRSRPGCPQDNGGHERIHVDMSRDLQARPANTPLAQQRRCDEWTTEFNHVRPHQALDMRTPAEVYKASPRKLPDLVVASYPPHLVAVRVSGSGTILCRGYKAYVSCVLAGHVVGLEARDVDVLVWLNHLPLGQFVPGVHEKVLPLLVLPGDTAPEPNGGSQPPAPAPEVTREKEEELGIW